MYKRFIKEKIAEIKQSVGNGCAVSALSGGVDSSTVTMLGHLALEDRLKTVFVDNGLMREKEPESVIATFKDLGIAVDLLDAKEKFLSALKGLVDPEAKRKAIKKVFYQDVFEDYRRSVGADFVLQGTILTDIEETHAGIKTQHNVDIQAPYKIIEPLATLRKDGVRAVAKELGLPASIYNRMPFPGPALAGRIIGEVTPKKVALVRQATAIVEEELKNSGAFQYLAILHDENDRVTGIKNSRRQLGYQIELRCWDSKDARKAKPTELPYKKLRTISARITAAIPEVVSVTYGITCKPPSTIEAV